MTNSNQNPQEPQKINTDGGTIIVTDAMGREVFWEDIGRKDDNGK